jgi:hypothetical protein
MSLRRFWGLAFEGDVADLFAAPNARPAAKTSGARNRDISTIQRLTIFMTQADENDDAQCLPRDKGRPVQSTLISPALLRSFSS